MINSDDGLRRAREQLQKMKPSSRCAAILRRIDDEDRPRFADLVDVSNADAPEPDVQRPWQGRAKRARRDQGVLTAAEAVQSLNAARAQWSFLGEVRHSSLISWTQQEADDYEQRRQRAKENHLKRNFSSLADDAVVDRAGAGLPPAHSTRFAADWQRWCISGSWCICPQCFVLQPQDMRPRVVNKVPAPYAMDRPCGRCNAKRQHEVPTSLPVELQNLSLSAAEALAPMAIDCGPEVRSRHSAGWRQHSAMCTFHWKPLSVEAQIDALSDDDAAKAVTACCFLYDTNELYRQFVDEHDM
eukprot:9809568-Karenia_brevis.AAC.1